MWEEVGIVEYKDEVILELRFWLIENGKVKIDRVYQKTQYYLTEDSELLEMTDEESKENEDYLNWTWFWIDYYDIKRGFQQRTTADMNLFFSLLLDKHII